MRKLLLASVLFLVPIVVVLAMNPDATSGYVKDAQAWVKKTFPEPPKKSPPRRRR